MSYIDKNIVDKVYHSTLLYHTKSKYQDIKIYNTKDFGKLLVIDDDIQLNEDDEHIYHEMMAHVPLMCLPDASSVLIIGAGDGGICREVLKHQNIKTIIQVEIDEEVINTCLEYFPDITSSLKNKRVKVYINDAYEWINTYGKLYQEAFDVIIADTTDFGSSESLFTDKFYVNIKKLLNKTGIFVFNCTCIGWYADYVKEQLDYHKTMYKHCRIYQMYLPMYGSGNYGVMFCSDYVDPLNYGITKSSFINKDIETEYYDTDVHNASFILSKNLKELFYDDNINDKIKTIGYHLILDLEGVGYQLLNDIEKINNRLLIVLDLHNLIIVKTAKYKFEQQGVTICYILSTSHMSIHTWPELNKCCIDLFTCNLSVDINKIAKNIIMLFNPDTYNIKYVDRS